LLLFPTCDRELDPYTEVLSDVQFLELIVSNYCNVYLPDVAVSAAYWFSVD